MHVGSLQGCKYHHPLRQTERSSSRLRQVLLPLQQFGDAFHPELLVKASKEELNMLSHLSESLLVRCAA